MAEYVSRTRGSEALRIIAAVAAGAVLFFTAQRAYLLVLAAQQLPLAYVLDSGALASVLISAAAAIGLVYFAGTRTRPGIPSGSRLTFPAMGFLLLLGTSIAWLWDETSNLIRRLNINNPAVSMVDQSFGPYPVDDNPTWVIASAFAVLFIAGVAFFLLLLGGFTRK